MLFMTTLWINYDRWRYSYPVDVNGFLGTHSPPGLGGMLVPLIAFGASPHYGWALVARLAMGLLSGIACICKACFFLMAGTPPPGQMARAMFAFLGGGPTLWGP